MRCDDCRRAHKHETTNVARRRRLADPVTGSLAIEAQRAYARARYQRRPEMAAEVLARKRERDLASYRRRMADAEYAAERRRVARTRRLRKMYGITLDDYEAMFARQGCCCAICGSPTSRGHGDGWHVDHDHGNGSVRGILCGDCNIGLGRFRDNPQWLRLAADYLERATTSRPSVSSPSR